MRNITTDELALIHGAGLDKDASVAIGTAAGGFLGKVRISRSFLPKLTR